MTFKIFAMIWPFAIAGLAQTTTRTAVNRTWRGMLVDANCALAARSPSDVTVTRTTDPEPAPAAAERTSASGIYQVAAHMAAMALRVLHPITGAL